MNKTELKAIRQEIKFSMDNVAACLGVPKSTYARYEDGTAAVPAKVARAATELLQINRTFIADLPARVDRRIAETGGISA